ncbi:hypothetical protein MPER_01204, partial [Moniliophthora perniciosa FA553]
RRPKIWGIETRSSIAAESILWTQKSDEYIVALGIDWYPNREWALLLPSYSIFLVLLTYWVYISSTIYGAPAFDDISAIADSRMHAREDATPALYDIPIGLQGESDWAEV